MPDPPSQRHVEYILVAEFDIDKGSQLSMQHPSPTGTEENILAELMLPDGAHKREADWTVFFLNQTEPFPQPKRKDKGKSLQKDAENEAPRPWRILEAYLYKYTEASNGWELQGEFPKKLYLEKDRLGIYELDEQEMIADVPANEELQYQQMEPLYDCLIANDIAYGFRFSSEADETTFLEHLAQLSKPRPAVKEEPPAPAPKPAPSQDQIAEEEVVAESGEKKPLLYVLNLVRTKHIQGVRRGARTKAMAICTRHQFLHVYKPLLLLALDRFFNDPRPEVVTELFEAINATDLSQMPILTEAENKIIRGVDANHDDTTGKDKKFFEARVNYNGIPIPLRIPLGIFPDEIGDFSLINLVNKFQSINKSGETGIGCIMNALLTQKRIVFLGYQHPSGEVANYVLASCAIFSPILRGFTERAFPYCNLTNVDTVLNFPGFIAGVTNPTFAEHEKWWDILCDIETGKVTVASHAMPAEPEKHYSRDSDFLADVLFAIQSRRGEERVRAMFRDYIQRLTDLAEGDAEYPDESAKKKDLMINQSRFDAWRKTISYQHFRDDKMAMMKQTPFKDNKVLKGLAKLKIRKDLTEREVADIFREMITHVNSEDQVIELLSNLPGNEGGLYPVALGIVHPLLEVRKNAVRLIHRIERTKAGSTYMRTLNKYLLLGYERAKREVGMINGDDL